MGICHYAWMTRYMSFRKQLDRSREPLRETMGAFQSWLDSSHYTRKCCYGHMSLRFLINAYMGICHYAFIHYICHYGLADNAYMGICHYAWRNGSRREMPSSISGSPSLYYICCGGWSDAWIEPTIYVIVHEEMAHILVAECLSLVAEWLKDIIYVAVPRLGSVIREGGLRPFNIDQPGTLVTRLIRMRKQARP